MHKYIFKIQILVSLHHKDQIVLGELRLSHYNPTCGCHGFRNLVLHYPVTIGLKMFKISECLIMIYI